MFSQFRNAVEHLAAQPIRRSISQDSDASNPNVMSRTNSEGGIPSSSHLADSALSSIRKSLQAQRSSSPAHTGANGNGGLHDFNRPRSRLEERLRASLSFGIGEASTEVSTNATNTPISTKAPTPLPEHDTTPLSPTQTPLPDSPISLPTAEDGTVGLPSPLSLGDPLDANSPSHPLAPPIPKSESQPEPPAPATHATTNDVPSTRSVFAHPRSKSIDSSLLEKLERMAGLEENDEEFQGRKYAEAQMPLPPSPPPESTKLPPVDPPTPGSEHQPAVVDGEDKGDVSLPFTAEPSQIDPDIEADPANITISSTSNTDGDTTGTDVDALRQQLKRFKERFTGSEIIDIG